MRYIILLLGIISLSLVPLEGLQAQEIPDNQCLCYCTSSSGATQEDLVDDSGTCAAFCDSEDRSILQCYTSGQEEQLPENNNLCWTQEDCEADIVETHDGDTPSIWGNQERKCMVGRGYCYNPPGTLNPYTGKSATAQLGVQIGDLERPDDLAEYIGAIYRFLLPVGALLAVLMFMIAGFQWMTARGDASQLSAAKTRLGTATLGLVILLLAYTIAVLIDPNLVTFNVFRVPKVQSVIYLDGANSCENLAARGAVIDPKEGYCGATGIVESLENVAAGNVVIGVEENAECPFSLCANDFERCSSSGGASVPECVRCSDVHGGPIGGTSLSPSKSLCGNLSLNEDPAYAALDEHFYCEYVDTDYFDTQTDFCAEIVYPSNTLGLDCDVLEEDYGANCRAYDFVQAYIDGNHNEIDDIEGEDGVFPLLDTICSSNPCGFAPAGESCTVFAYDGSGLYGLADEVFANCANTSSLLGFDDCLNEDGTDGDCLIAKDGFDIINIQQLKESVLELLY